MSYICPRYMAVEAIIYGCVHTSSKSKTWTGAAVGRIFVLSIK